MNILHWMRAENSGLVRSTLEIAQWEEKAGHQVSVRTPSENTSLYETNGEFAPDIHSIHSQLNPLGYFDRKPKLMWCHGEPLSSVGNKVSMRAIVDLAAICDAFICMRKDEWSIWNAIKRTFVVPKGIDLEVYHPLGNVEKLSGSPAVLYCENWRGDRNPLYLCVAMQEVHKKFPDARLHLYNCTDSKMFDTFKQLYRHCHWWPFLRSLQGPVDDANELYNKADIVVSCLYPLYARSMECFGAGKALICPGYREEGYPWRCDLSPESIAGAIIDCWEGYGKVDYRKWALGRHDIQETVRQALDIYGRYI